MGRSIAFGIAAMAGLVGLGLLSRQRGGGGRSFIADLMAHRMEQVMARLPEGSPPKLVMSVLPQLRDQNEQVIALLREHNTLLREYLQRPR